MLVSVRTCFFDFSKRFEGYTDWLYLDIKCLVTIGLGNLVDPEPLVYAIDFVNPDGAAVSYDQIKSAWQTVKSHTEGCKMGGGWYRKLTSIRATEDSIRRLIDAKLSLFNQHLVQYFPNFESWPHNAQLAVLSMAWAMGPDFPPHWPQFTSACNAQDWATASTSCHMRDADNPGLRPRNAANEQLFKDLA